MRWSSAIILGGTRAVCSAVRMRQRCGGAREVGERDVGRCGWVDDVLCANAALCGGQMGRGVCFNIYFDNL